jgi:ADP-heptose:LPS heptosyltransferase
MVGTKERVGFYDKRAYRGNLHTKRVSFNINDHVTDNFLNLVKTVGVDTKVKKSPILHTDNVADRYIEELLKKEGIAPDDTIILINANASTLSLQRRWPKENYREIISMLSDNDTIKILLIGARSDFEYVASLCNAKSKSENVINFAGKTTVLQLLSLLKRSQLLITNDSGPLHFAAALNIPTISFFGPETPRLYGPLGAKHTILYKNIDCSPCIHAVNTKLTNCKYPLCMDKIRADEVKKAINSLLTQSKEQDFGCRCRSQAV